MHTTKRSRKYRKKSKNRGGPKFNPEVAGRREGEGKSRLTITFIRPVALIEVAEDIDLTDREDFD